MTWKCKTGGCTLPIPKETAIDCVCAQITLGKTSESEIQKLEHIERLRVRKAIEATLPKLVEALNEKEAV